MSQEISELNCYKKLKNTYITLFSGDSFLMYFLLIRTDDSLDNG